MEIHEGADGISVETGAYRLRLDPVQPVARLTDAAGGDPLRLFLLAGLDSDHGLDCTVAVSAPRLQQTAGGCVLSYDVTSTAWDSKQVRLRCSEEEVA